MLVAVLWVLQFTEGSSGSREALCDLSVDGALVTTDETTPASLQNEASHSTRAEARGNTRAVASTEDVAASLVVASEQQEDRLLFMVFHLIANITMAPLALSFVDG
jgi:hypothetical protein